MTKPIQNPFVSFVEGEPRSIGSVAELKDRLVEAHAHAEVSGVCLIRKGLVRPEVLATLCRISSVSGLRRPQIEEDDPDDDTQARSFGKGVLGVPNAFMHKHGSVAVVPEGIDVGTVVARDDSVEEVFRSVLRDNTDRINRALRGMTLVGEAKETWGEVESELRRGLFPEECQSKWIGVTGGLQRYPHFNDLGMRIANEMETSLAHRGQLWEIPWADADAGVIHYTTAHARDCRKRNLRTKGTLHTWAFSTQIW